MRPNNLFLEGDIQNLNHILCNALLDRANMLENIYYIKNIFATIQNILKFCSSKAAYKSLLMFLIPAQISWYFIMQIDVVDEA